MEQQGVRIDIFPLLRERTTLMHPEAVPLVSRAHFQPFLSFSIVLANLYTVLCSPLVYFGTLLTVLRATFGSLRFFFGVIGIFPKSVYLARLMKRDDITHIHAHFASHPAAAAFIIHRFAGIPYSFTAHGSDLHCDQHMLREKVSEAAFVVAISEFNKELIVNECGNHVRNKIHVIHCGVDTSVFRPALRSSNRQDPSHILNIVCTGTLHEVKGQIHLLKACHQLRQRGCDFVCHLVGDGPDRDLLTKNTADMGLKEYVRFHGRRTREEIARLLQEAHVVVAPSVPTRDGRREGIPVVLMEAMASGLPVVASNISGIPELVTHRESGLLVPPGDSVALGDALEQLLRDSRLRESYGVAGRAKILSAFDVKNNAAALVEQFGMGCRSCA